MSQMNTTKLVLLSIGLLIASISLADIHITGTETNILSTTNVITVPYYNDLLGYLAVGMTTNYLDTQTNTIDMTPNYTNLKPSECSILAYVASASNNVDYSAITNTVKEWAKAGTICQVLGHRWVDGRVGEGFGKAFADHHPNTWYRHCDICNVGQSKSTVDWK